MVSVLLFFHHMKYRSVHASVEEFHLKVTISLIVQAPLVQLSSLSLPTGYYLSQTYKAQVG